MIIFTLTGVFKEPDTKGSAMRHFFRKFILIPVGAGFSVVNDMLFVTNATQQQIKKSFSTPAPLPAPSAPLPAAHPAGASTAGQYELIQNLSAQSGMNALWSRKCVIYFQFCLL